MAFNSLGKAISSIVVAVMRKFVLLIPLIYIMPHIFTTDQTMAVYMAEPVADFYCSNILQRSCFLYNLRKLLLRPFELKKEKSGKF